MTGGVAGEERWLRRPRPMQVGDWGRGMGEVAEEAKAYAGG